jgi:hypothetical protein
MPVNAWDLSINESTYFLCGLCGSKYKIQSDPFVNKTGPDRVSNHLFTGYHDQTLHLSSFCEWTSRFFSQACQVRRTAAALDGAVEFHI